MSRFVGFKIASSWDTYDGQGVGGVGGGILTIFSYKIQVMLECGAIMADLLASGSPVVGTLVMDRGGYYEDYLWMSTI